MPIQFSEYRDHQSKSGGHHTHYTNYITCECNTIIQQVTHIMSEYEDDSASLMEEKSKRTYNAKLIL